MLCARCGAPNADTTPFCRACGALLEAGSGIPPTVRKQAGQSFVGSSWEAVFEQQPAQSEPTETSAASPFAPVAQIPFAPVAHIPFNQDPLPQPSQPLPALIAPAGEVQTFTPAVSPFEPALPAEPEHSAPNRNLADYPTDVQVPIPPTLTQASALLPPYPDNAARSQPEARALANGAPAVASWGNATPLPGSMQGELSEPGWLSTDEKTPSPATGNIYHGSVTSVFKNDWPTEEKQLPVFPKSVSQPLTDDSQRPVSSTNVFNHTWNQVENPVPFTQASSAGPSLGNVYPGLPKNRRGARAFSDLPDIPLDQVNRFVRPLPFWASALSILGGALLLVGLVFLSPDWATGALIAGVVAIILAILLLIASGVRVALGMLSPINSHRISQAVSAGLLVLLLFVFSGISLSQQTGLHAMQARYLEGKQNWSAAIAEFQNAGEVAPSSSNLARVYNEWGEDLGARHQYADAIAKFGLVLSTYTGASAQVGRARMDTVSTYFKWADSATQAQDYANAASYYDKLLKLSYCDATCQSQAQPADATTYYDLAEQQLAQQQYTIAVNAYNVLSTKFPNAPEVKQGHGNYARALWGLGQQQLTATCSDAVKTYQQLANQFANTTEGQQAATALKKPVTVVGHFTTPIPGPPAHPAVSLVQGMYFGITDSQFSLLVNGAPHTSVQSDGHFTFSSVPQGTYTLVWSYDGQFNYAYGHNQKQLLYKIDLGSLCTYNYGDIPQVISSPQG